MAKSYVLDKGKDFWTQTIFDEKTSKPEKFIVAEAKGSPKVVQLIDFNNAPVATKKGDQLEVERQFVVKDEAPILHTLLSKVKHK